MNPEALLRQAESDGWVSAWYFDGSKYIVDHHSEEGSEVRSGFTPEEFAEAGEHGSGARYQLERTLNAPGRLIRDFGDRDDIIGWGDLDTPPDDDDDV